MIKTNKKVDVIVSVPWMFLYLPEVFDCPLITFSPAGPIPTLIAETGNEINLSIQPLINAGHIEPMTLPQRIQNHLLGAFFDVYTSVVTWYAGKARERALGHSTPSFHEILRYLPWLKYRKISNVLFMNFISGKDLLCFCQGVTQLLMVHGAMVQM